MSTIGPAEVLRLPELLAPGTGLLDAPVLGSIDEAAAGTLRLFVGGPDGLVARWRAVLETLGAVDHVGPLGAGAAAKLVANSTLFGVLATLGEAVALADALGLPRARTLELLAATPLAEQARRREDTLSGRGARRARFALDLARKDADLILAAAAERRVELPVAAAAARWLAAAQRAGHGRADYSRVLDTITDRTGK